MKRQRCDFIVDRIATSIQEGSKQAKPHTFAMGVKAAKQISKVVIGKFVAEEQQPRCKVAETFR